MATRKPPEPRPDDIRPSRILFERRGMGYVARIPEAGAEVSIDRIRTSSGETSGELVVERMDPTLPDGRILQARFNLSSVTARSTTARLLADRSPGLDWGVTLEMFSTRVLAAEREGEPIVKVGRDTVQDGDTYLLHPFLLHKRATILFGEGGSGKSYAAAGMAVAVASGIPAFAPMRFPEGYKPKPVLVLDWEADRFEWNERLQYVAFGMGIVPPDNIFYRACASPFTDMVEQVARFVADNGVGLVVVDSTGMASPVSREGGDASESAIRLFQGLREVGTTALLIDHVTGADLDKPGKVSKPYGSVYKMNLARSVWELKKGDPSPDGTRHIGIYHRKVNRGPLHPTIGLAVRHDDGATLFNPEEVSDPHLDSGQPLRVRIWNTLMEHGPMTTTGIATILDVDTASVRVTLNRSTRDFRKVGLEWEAIPESEQRA